MGISGSRKIGKMRSLVIVLLATVALPRANPCQNDQDVYFPDREDCGRFYMCRNGDVVGHMNCPDGLLWNTDLLTCDWPRNVDAHLDVLRGGALLGILATSSPGSALESSRQPRSSVRTWERGWWRSTLPRRTKPSLVWPRLPGPARTTDLTTGLVASSLLK